jgi:uncharacterized protein
MPTQSALQLDYILQNFSLSINGYGQAGAGEKVRLPKIKKHLEKYRGGGMIAPRQHALGYEEFEFEADLSSVNPQVISQSGLLVSTDIPFSVRALLDGDGGASHTLYLNMSGECVEQDFGEWEAGKKAMLKVKFALNSLKLIIDGATIFDIDIQNQVDTFGSSDIGSIISAAIGTL